MMNEIVALRFLKHPNIILLHEIYEDSKYVHMVFELMKGGELYARVKERNRLKECEAAVVMRKLLEAVNFCHNNGVIHRDIKPRNIILLYLLYNTNRDKNKLDIKLIDFGLIIIGKHKANKAKISGSAGYIAPEMFSGGCFNSKADIYSCGITLYYMLTGELPFLANQTVNLLRLNKRNKINLSECTWISKEAQDFIKELTHSNPNKRLTASKALKNPWLRRGVSSKDVSIESTTGQKFSENYFGCYNPLVKTTQSEYSASCVNDSLETTLIQGYEEGKANTPLPTKEFNSFSTLREQSMGGRKKSLKYRKNFVECIKDSIKFRESFLKHKKIGRDALPEMNNGEISLERNDSSFVLTHIDVFFKS